MKITRKLILNNLVVGLLPVIVTFAILLIYTRNQAEYNVQKRLQQSIASFRIYWENSLNKYRDYAYLISRNLGSNPIKLMRHSERLRAYLGELALKSDRFDVRMFEILYTNHSVFQDLYSWKDHIYLAEPEKSREIWQDLWQSRYNRYFTKSYPDQVFNIAVIRNCALIYDSRTQKKVGFTEVVTPLDSEFFSGLVFSDPGMLFFVKTPGGGYFSRYELNHNEPIWSMLEQYPDTSAKIKVITLNNTLYYVYSENLIRTTSRVSNRILQRSLVDLAVLLPYKKANRNLVLFQRLALSVFGVGLVLLILIAIVFGSRIVIPIYRLKREVEDFEDHSRPISLPARVSDEVGQLHKSMSEMSKTILTKEKQLEETHRAIIQDLKLSRKIQLKLFPQNLEKKYAGIRTHVIYESHSLVGGDVYDVTRVGRKIRVFLADAPGHGVQGALLTMLIKNEYDKLKNLEADLGGLIEAMDEVFSRNYRLLTVEFPCIIVDIDMHEHNICYVSAGHLDQYLFTGGHLRRLKSTGRMLGVKDLFSDPKKHLVRTFEIESGFQLYLFTDGVTEAVNEWGQILGDASVKQFIRSGRKVLMKQLLENLLQTAREYSEDQQFQDDVTIIGIENV